jgi:hypothetical protein
MLISPCGAICDECPFYMKPCIGCRNLDGKVFWSDEVSESGICPMYNCSVNDKGFDSCGKCKDLPCEMFYNMKDPNMTEEQHQESIVKRVKTLKN